MKKPLVFLLLYCCFLINNVFAQSVLLTPDKIDQRGGSNDNIYLRNDGNGTPNLTSVKHGGSFSSPSSTLSSSNLFRISVGGYGTSFLTAPSSILEMFSTENWTNSANGAGIRFLTTANGTTISSEKMIIYHNGYVGIGLSSPDQILDVNGRMRIRHTVIGGFPYTSGIWMSNSTNSLNGADGAFYGMITDTQAGIYIGNAWRFAVNSNGNVVNTGFTQLGNDVPAGAAVGATAPSIKTLKLIGTTAATQGGSASVTHGLSFTKILSYSVLVNIGGSTPALITPEYTGDTALKYTAFCVGSSVFLINSPANSSGLLSKPFKVFITYEE
jgi:hypothetical protein